MSRDAQASSVLPLLGTRVLLLHGPETHGTDAGLSGRDIDCAVLDIDPMWPLRLPDGWRLVQSLHYDFYSWYSVLERDGRVVEIDATDDPWGLGRDAIDTRTFFAPDTGALSPSLRAAYLAVKRIRKGNVDPAEWARIRDLASVDRDAFRTGLRSLVGERVAEVLSPLALRGASPDHLATRRVNRQRYLRRFGSPARVARALGVAASRYVDRIGHPAGFTVLIVGPDGSGKSSVAARVIESCGGMFKRQVRYHWRPGVLPRPGSIVRKDPSDPTAPHARAPFPSAASLAFLGYYWIDFLLGDLIVYRRHRIRTGLVVTERGWWDLMVDPARYRLRVPAGLVRALGRVLRAPDLTVVLDGKPEVLLERKDELSPAEMERQLIAWRSALPGSVRQLRIDATRSLDEITGEVRNEVVRLLEARAIGWLGSGWATLPGGPARWWLPRGPRAVAVAGLGVYRPVKTSSRVGWSVVTALTAVGGLRLFPRGAAPPPGVRRALAPHVPAGGSFALARANHPGRFVALLLDGSGAVSGFAKIAVDASAAATLDREADSIERFAGALPADVSVPRITSGTPGVLVFEPVTSVPWPRPFELDEPLASALGSFFRGGEGHDPASPLGLAHGDMAPWNVLRTQRGWTLVDWEHARSGAEPFHDLCHWVVQTHTLLGNPSEDDVLAGFHEGRGWIGRAIAAYADAAGVDASEAGSALEGYLRTTTPSVRATTRQELVGVERRHLLLARLEARP